jgi:hypothetical protein
VNPNTQMSVPQILILNVWVFHEIGALDVNRLR